MLTQGEGGGGPPTPSLQLPESVSDLVATAPDSSSPSMPSISASLYDSVSDLKRIFQDTYAEEFSISGRKLDRDGLHVGWDVLHEGRAMSYHLFLDDYGVEHGDILHVVIERVGEERDAEEERKWRKMRRELKNRSV